MINVFNVAFLLSTLIVLISYAVDKTVQQTLPQNAAK